MATVAFDVDMWRLASVAGAEPKRVSRLEVKCRHGTDRRHGSLSAAYVSRMRVAAEGDLGGT
jgi:hypothetical protein